LAKQNRIRVHLSPRNIFLAAGLVAILVTIIVRLVEGSDYFGFVYVFAPCAGLASFVIVWSSLTLFHVFALLSMGREAFFEPKTWIAILAFCLGLFLAVKLVIEIRA
jgi:hypothetical protein